MKRRGFLGASGALFGAAAAGAQGMGQSVAPNWSALTAAYRTPDWFRDAKFGIWAHWSAQCVPEAGDWYGRLMYVPGDDRYDHHLRTYGHPADTGFMEMENRWKAEAWDPAYLVRRYKEVGARYFMALAAHHDNFDCWNSRHHEWNSVRVGPKRDIVGTWAKIVRAEGLRFGVSNHISHAWHWWQTAYGYDAEGPRAGQRYDAFRLTKADGKGKWWDGLDPQQLYTGPAMVPPDGITDNQAMRDWHDANTGRWMQHSPPQNPHFVAKWLARQMDLVEQHDPDLVYLDDYGLPFGSTGIEALAHYYSRSMERRGAIDVVLTAKNLSAYQRRALVEDIERGFSDRLREEPWQTCTCIGDWHYNRSRFLERSYVPAEQVIQRLADIVSKNGNLLLSVPVRGDGSIDAEEEKILDGIRDWMRVNGETAIYGSRPWRIYGEGPTVLKAGMHTEDQMKAFSAQDVRFTVKDGGLNILFLKWPDGPVRVPSLGTGRLPDAQIAAARMASGQKVGFDRQADALVLTLPRAPSGGGIVPVVRLEGRGLV
ncbi:alpha-L-fucosidase [Sphingomonas sp. BGYR3]|uniref:alpha-L-fucosidase n=1 Tax=Sphingomonas sp. BGYR3 TaxID=2975483 RepID=UPI0021A746AF|nr:alpha-L-fucosidase [Sphingomonas sp. BGYR3]MDG5489174.1 alpha-L-fucosidase [Sphingomonas sp. BGYR3]